jgi:hypothetical protein
MSDLFANKVADKRKELQDLLEEQAKRIPDIEEFSAMAKKFGIDTTDVDELLKVAKAVFKASGVKIPKPPAETPE